MSDVGYTLTECGGQCPTQAEGVTDEGLPFYFRFRHGHWSLETFPPGRLYDWYAATLVADGYDDRQADGTMWQHEVEAILEKYFG